MEKRLEIVIENCPQNHKCPAVKVCPVGALTQEEFEAPKINYDKCVKCGKCSNFCPKKALVLHWFSKIKFISMISKIFKVREQIKETW